MTRLAVAAILGFAFALAALSSAAAQGGPDVQISKLECIDSPDAAGIQELVVVTNQGGAPQSLTGWELRSDPEANEMFDLSVVGSLLPGGSVSIQSGPSASGVFIWSTSEVFRDNDPPDYVKLVDNTGATVQQVNCPGSADTDGDGLTDAQEQQLGTDPNNPDTDADGLTDGDEQNVHGTNPLVADTDGDGSTDGEEIAQGTDPLDASSTPVNGIPNGGGPPPPSADMLSPGMIILIGGSLAAAGLGAIALPRLRLRPSPVAVSPPSRRPAARHVRGHGDGKPGYSTVSLVAVAFTAVIFFRFLRRSSD